VDLEVRLDPWVTFSDTNGFYRLLSSTGRVALTVTDLARGDSGSAAAVLAGTQDSLVLDVSTTSLGPKIASVSPEANSTKISRVAPVVVTFNTAINPGSFGVTGIRLLDPNNQPVQTSVALNLKNTIATLLPTAAYFLRMNYPPARKLIENNCAVALASDYNPGSSPSGNMNVVVSMACIKMRMLPEEAINAATINGAYAMELENEVGSISVGKKANLIFTKPIPSLAFLPYSFGSNLVETVIVDGQIQRV
jgi:hypothetical protein